MDSSATQRRKSFQEATDSAFQSLNDLVNDQDDNNLDKMHDVSCGAFHTSVLPKGTLEAEIHAHDETLYRMLVVKAKSLLVELEEMRTINDQLRNWILLLQRKDQNRTSCHLLPLYNVESNRKTYVLSKTTIPKKMEAGTQTEEHRGRLKLLEAENKSLRDTLKRLLSRPSWRNHDAFRSLCILVIAAFTFMVILMFFEAS